MKYPNRILGADAAPYASHVTQQFPMGQVMELPNGKIFRYAKMGGTLGVANKLYQAAVGAGNWDSLAVVTCALGASTISLTNGATAITENNFAEGSVVEETAAGLGHCYPVKSNTAAGAATCVFTLADGVTVQNALTAGTHTMTVEPNPWKDIVIMASPQTSLIVGIPLVVIAIGGCGWVQTHGVCSCVYDDTGGTETTPADKLRPSEDDDGGVALFNADEADDANLGEIAWCMFTTPDADFGHVFLMIE